MTVAENVAYGLMVKKVPKSERRQRADETLAMVRCTFPRSLDRACDDFSSSRYSCRFGRAIS